MASRVGKYLLFETLGEGAFGKVKLGVHEESGEQVAVKIMDKSDIKAQEMTMNVRREIAIMKALKHRNIVNLRQVLTSQSKLYIVMDLVTGGELFTKILNEGKLEESIARRYFQQLADGIEYCHRRGVCHRDLKPENLLIDETTGELKITDFGLSAMKGASTTEELLHTQCGSPNYCAPEIIARHKQGYNGTKVDAWSCGIILFALLAGFLPFYDENTKTLYRMIQRDDVKFPKRFPPDAKDLVLRLLHKEPEKRYTLAEVKKHPWFAVDYDGDDALPKTGPSPPARRRKRAHHRSKSIDHGPKSRELAIPGAHGSDSSQPKSMSSALPAAPPLIDSSPRHIPSAHRPPPPPTVPQPPRSPAKVRPQAISTSPTPPLPPVPPPVPVSPLMQPPPPPPTIPHPAVGSTRPVPPYPGTTALSRRKSRDSRDSYPSDIPSSPTPDSPSLASPSTGSNTLPSYPAISDPPAAAHPPAPPPFPAPVQPQERTEGHTYPTSVPNGHGSKTTTAPLPPPPNYGAPSRGGHVPSLPPIPEVPPPKSRPAPVVVPPTRPVDSKAATGKAGNVSPQRASKSKWTVVGPSPPLSYTAGMAPVTTPSALAHGDDSWQKHAESVKAGEVVAPKVEEKKEIVVEKEKIVEEEVKKPTIPKRPLSIVEQRRMMYNKHPDLPPPLPDTELSRVASSKKMDDGPLTPKPVSPLAQKFGDRVEIPRATGYPGTDGKKEPGDPADTSGSPPRNGEGALSGSTAVANAVEHVLATAAKEIEPLSGDAYVLNDSAPVEVVEKSVGGIIPPRGSGITILDEDDSLAVPLKKRLAAAVARYRRIFKLGNNIGITSSPSFNSNKGSHLSLASADDETIKPGGDKSEFFARAKAVTGAWGIILTQEMDDESDSDEDSPQVTELELEAFSRLLDFWDNRRASANISKGTEVILDDEEVSPLSQKDILSIQSLLQKLEPKQVEEMEEVAGGDGSSEVAEPTTPEIPDDANSMDSRTDSGKRTVAIDLLSSAVDHSQSNGRDHGIASASGDSLPDATPRVVSVPPTAPPPLPPPRPPMNSMHNNLRTPPPPPPPIISKPEVGKAAPWDRPNISANTEAPPPAPPLPPTVHISKPSSSAPPPPPPPPPSYNAPGAAASADPRRLVVTPSTVIDPFRPGAPPSYPPPELRGNGSSSMAEADDLEANSKIVQETTAALKQGGRLPQRSGHETEAPSKLKRGSSVEVQEAGIQPKTVARDSGRVNSAASGASNGSSSGNPQRRQMRSPSRDEHATRGMFGLSMFNRRKSSAATSFDSDHPPERCLLEIGRILVTTMNCNVLMKRGESKMKCEVPLKQGKILMISITCHQEKSVSTVHFKRGRKDKSHIDGKEFYEFFQKVRTLFIERVGSETRAHT